MHSPDAECLRGPLFLSLIPQPAFRPVVVGICCAWSRSAFALCVARCSHSASPRVQEGRGRTRPSIPWPRRSGSVDARAACKLQGSGAGAFGCERLACRRWALQFR
eukprot:3746611-Rhodomonas_salina.1